MWQPKILILIQQHYMYRLRTSFNLPLQREKNNEGKCVISHRELDQLVKEVSPYTQIRIPFS